MEFDHVLLTRFNLPSGGVENLIRADPTWLSNRWELFTRFTVPSVRAQSRRIRWLIYFDSQSPGWLREAVDPFVVEGLFTAQFAEAVPLERLLDDLTRLVGPGRYEHLATTNLDNDDALGAGFSNRIDRVPYDGTREAVYLAEGLVLAGARVYHVTDRRNAFCSVIEPWSGARTCWSEWHNLLGRTMPVVVRAGEGPAWMQVVHGQNVSNRVRGRLVRSSKYAAEFPRVLGVGTGGSEPSPRELLADRLLAAPARRAVIGLRSAVRYLGVRVLGKAGWDGVKVHLGAAVRATRRISRRVSTRVR